MLIVGLLGMAIRPGIVTLVYVLLMAPGWVLTLWARLSWRLPHPSRAELPYLVLLMGICTAVIFNALLWPFYRDDALGIYLPFALEMYETQALAPITPQRNLYELYPQLMSNSYAYTFSISGWSNPYAAKLPNALLSLALVASALCAGA
jgi:hypothetical protein